MNQSDAGMERNIGMKENQPESLCLVGIRNAPLWVFPWAMSWSMVERAISR